MSAKYVGFSSEVADVAYLAVALIKAALKSQKR